MKKIAILYGGPSNESEVSKRSALNVFNVLKKSCHCEMVEFGKDIETRIKTFDEVFNIMHGTPGEDGIVQGMLECLGIPYTGSGVIASALTINKFNTQSVMERMRIPVPKAVFINKHVLDNNADILKIFSKKIIFKPNTGGSSVGSFIADANISYDKLNNKIEQYGAYIAEEYIDSSKEITVGIIEKSGKPFVLTPLELKPGNIFYDYEAKYTKGMTEFILPPELDQNVIEQIKKYAEQIFISLNLKSFARVDFIIKGNDIFELEVNSVPGMTDLSDLPAEAEYDGISYDELVNIIIQTTGVNKDA